MTPKNGNYIELDKNSNQQAKKQKKQGNFTFDQSVVLKQSSMWAKAIAGTIMGVTTFTVIWAATAKIEQVVPAQGKLEPIGKVREVKVPVNGRAVVQEVFVEEGDSVSEGKLLLTLDTATTKAQLSSLLIQRDSLSAESEFYQALISNGGSIANLRSELDNLNLSPGLLALARNRIALIAENQLYVAQLNGNSSQLSPDQRIRWRAARAEFNSRANAAQLEVQQITEQLNRNRIQLQDARTRLGTETSILNQLTPLVESGGIARLQYVQQQQTVNTQKAEVAQLISEQKRLAYDISQARQELNNAIATTQKDVLDRMGENKKRIAEIDSQITARLVENNRRIAELDAQIKQTTTTLDYQEVTAPIAGRVFDLKASPQGVLESNQAETILKIVPKDGLIAEVFVTNQDIGFVAEKLAIARENNEELTVDVRIDSFPFSEFGDIKGKVVYIGSDALPPDQIYNFYRFPVRIELESQQLEVRGQKINLQTGMSVTANIKINENRTVLSIFTDLFNDQIEALKKS
ncbi:MAG: HlyD family efflux transporter periplasmic adaptor subunit [Prochloraceae cyanobacterium]|nr:HlyD family efflux transporter periplasmic adaptor subunit [Prochloraceae cyanobacterium]